MKEEERKAAKHHCGPGNSYPINSQADAHDAWNLAGHADNPSAVRACVRRVAKAEGWSLPKTASVRASMGEVVFSDEEWVTRTGKIFAVGDYDHPDPEQRFSFTPDDAERVVSAFQPVFAETEHFFTDERPSIFDGKIGQLQKVWREGQELFGEIRVPSFVDRVWGDAGRKISLVFDPVSKMIIRCGLVLRPRVPDAVMMSAPETGDDAAAEAGEIALARAYAESADRGRSGKHETPTLKEQIMEENAGQKGETGVGTTGAGVPPVEFAATLDAMRAENERLRKEQQQTATTMAELQAERRSERARARITTLVETDHRLPPALFNEAVAALARAYEDDERTPVQFAATEGGTKRNRAETLLTLLGQLPQSQMMNERIQARVLRFSDDSTEDAAKNPLTTAGAEAGARTWAEQQNKKNGRG